MWGPVSASMRGPVRSMRGAVRATAGFPFPAWFTYADLSLLHCPGAASGCRAILSEFPVAEGETGD